MAGPRHGENAWFWIAILFALAPAFLVGFAIYSWFEQRNSIDALGASTRREIEALVVKPHDTAEIEKKWSAGFEGGELVAPIGPSPCSAAVTSLPPTQRADAIQAFAALEKPDVDERIREISTVANHDPTNLLVALITGREFVALGDTKNGERLMIKSLASTSVPEDMDRAAKDPNSTLTLHDDGAETVIHLRYTLGVAQLISKANSPWNPLKEAIGSARLLSRHSMLGRTAQEAPESRLTLNAPGCTQADRRTLSSYDIFNNLIVAYLRGGYANSVERDRWFRRETSVHPSGVRQLFTALVRYAGKINAGKTNWPSESELWALSNVDALLDERKPDNARLCYNIVRLLDWWTAPERCPPAICNESLMSDLWNERNALLTEALARRDVGDDQHAKFAAGILQMLATSGIRPSSIKDDLNALREWLPPDQAHVVDDLINAEEARQALPKWLMRVEEKKEDPPWAVLGPNANAWREAALVDFANDVAEWAKEHPVGERKVIAAVLLRKVDRPEARTALVSLVPSRDRFWFDLWTSHWSWIAVAAAIAVLFWLFIVWVLLQVREKLLLRKSFYEVELHFIDQISDTQRR